MFERNILAREDRKPTRREMTNAIRDFLPDTPHKGMMYKHFSDLAYKAALGKTAKQLREERGAPARANLTEFLTAREIENVKQSERLIAILLESGMDYQSIKDIVFSETPKGELR